MAHADGVEGGSSGLETLLGYLDADPDNLSLTAAAATRAFEEGRLDTASMLVDRYGERASLPADMRNLRGLVALSSHRFDLAAAQFEALLPERPDDAGLRFNFAWSKAMLQDYAGAAELIDQEVISAVPRAAALKVQVLHHMGRLEEALEEGRAAAERFPQEAGLMGALSAVAIDAGDLDLAAAYGKKARGAPDGLATLGMLELGHTNLAAAAQQFDKALNVQADHARALLGRGLVRLAAGDPEAAIPDIDRSAALFGDHLGSWLAAGWARLGAGDIAGARKTFEKALEIDDTFAETHGALAVLDVMQRRDADARRRIEVALRLDKNCFSAALAQVLCLQAQGKTASANRITSTALNTPVGPSGRTMGQALAQFGRLKKF